MDSGVLSEITSELPQTLSNLILGDNQLRQRAEETVNESLSRNPEGYLLALVQCASSADTEVMRSFSFVLLRRLLFRELPGQQVKTPRLTLYDNLPAQYLTLLEGQLLQTLLREPSPSVRRKSVDTICELANNAVSRGRPWNSLQTQAFTMTQDADALSREAAYRVFAGSPSLIADVQTDVVLNMLQRGLQDAGSIEVRHAALKASVSYLTSLDAVQLAQAMPLVYPMLDTLPHVPTSHLPTFLEELTPLCTSHPFLFNAHFSALLSFLPGLVLPSVDPGPTPTVARPFPTAQRAFIFPPPPAFTSSHAEKDKFEDEAHEREAVRKAALEFMVSLSEASPSTVRKQHGWVNAVVRGCLEGMGELPDDAAAMQAWLEADPSDDPTDDAYPHVYEQALDRLACCLGGKTVLPTTFQYIPSMLADFDWRLRHAGLMAIAAIGEGTSSTMQKELGKVVDLIIPLFDDSNPRVRYAACQCLGQLCTDLEEVIQAEHHQQIFTALAKTLDAPEPRVYSHAAAALINFCEGVERDTLVPYLDMIVERLLRLLNTGNNASEHKRYAQEQAITTLAMVADASEAAFSRHYGSIMPLLLDLLANATGPEYGKLRVKAMECAGLIAIAVGREVFRKDAGTLMELLMRIQNTPIDKGDTCTVHYLLSTWAKVCQALGPEFEPYLPVVMPSLLSAANVKADISLYSDDVQNPEEREGWETVCLDGQLVGVRTSAMEEKCQAFETLLVYSTTLGAQFAPYLAQSLETTLPSLRFYFHDGVREACVMLVPALLACGKSSGTLTEQMVSATLLQIIGCIGMEMDSSFLSSLYKCLTNSLMVLGGASILSTEMHEGLVAATKNQLQVCADRRKARAERAISELTQDREELALVQEMEDFALDDMAKLLRQIDANHPLLIAISSVKDLGFNDWGSDDGDDEESWRERYGP